MAEQLVLPVPITRAQVRRLQALWRRWAGHLRLPRAADSELRHYYVKQFSDGRAKTTAELTSADAERVIARLEWLVSVAPARNKIAEGTAGRRGFPERRDVPPTGAAWRTLWACARDLEMDRADVEFFIRQHYAGRHLRGLADIHTMADLNRVLWGLKAILRHGRKPQRAAQPAGKRAA